MDKALSALFRPRTLAIAALAAFALFLLIQPGNLSDEPEHLHVAWLMTMRGLRPIHDFFEHHPPVLWWVLGGFYRAGIGGPEVLYAARVLVLACVAACLLSLHQLVGRWSGVGRPGVFAVALFVLSGVFAQELLVTRPETLSAALTFLALLVWTRPSRPAALAAAAGALFSAACCASPRFALLAPAFLLADRERSAKPGIASWVAAAAGGAGVFAAFLAWMCPWQDLLFILRFSSLLQHVGSPANFDLRYLAACAFIAAAIWGALLAVAEVPRRRALAWAAHGAAVWAICIVTCGNFPYSQAFAPALFWNALFAAWLESRPAKEEAARPVLVRATLAGTAVAAAVQLLGASSSFSNAPSQTASRRLLLNALPPDAHVLMLPHEHPITVADASYWGSLLIYDAPGRLSAAVTQYHERFPDAAVQLPRFDFEADLRRARADAVSRLLYITAPLDQIGAVQARVNADYAPTDALDDAPAKAFAANVFLRKP